MKRVIILIISLILPLAAGAQAQINTKKVKISVARREENKKSILEFVVMMDDVAVPESAPRDDGNKTVVILKKRN